jgi:hypothetical protein
VKQISTANVSLKTQNYTGKQDLSDYSQPAEKKKKIEMLAPKRP